MFLCNLFHEGSPVGKFWSANEGLSEGIPNTRVKATGNEQEVWFEDVERRDDHSFKSCAISAIAAARREWDVEIVAEALSLAALL